MEDNEKAKNEINILGIGDMIMRPKTSEELILRIKNLIPDLDKLEKDLKKPEEVVSRAFPKSRIKFQPRSIVVGMEEGVELEEKPDEIEKSIRTEQTRVVETAGKAVAKLNTEGATAKFDTEELFALEAIVLIEGRPAILIQSGVFFPPPPQWDVLNEHKNSIEETIQSVGRIEVSGHPRLDWVGTGFLVADDVIMTNRHVAEEFCLSRELKFISGIKPRIDYSEEFGTPISNEFDIKEIIGITERPGPDMALLRVAPTEGKELPSPLTVASEVPDTIEGRDIYILGYPAWDGRRNDPAIMRKIFNEIYDVKRLQPGKAKMLQGKDLLHDCSTLGGNSGSCVIDLMTNQVIGLHYGGHYQDTNYSVAIPLLKEDPVVKKAKLNFDE